MLSVWSTGRTAAATGEACALTAERVRESASLLTPATKRGASGEGHATTTSWQLGSNCAHCIEPICLYM